MDYKYRYVTDLDLGVKSFRKISKENKSNTEDKINIFEYLSTYLNKGLDKLNKILEPYEIRLEIYSNDLENNNNKYILILSNNELDVGYGVTTLALSFKASSDVLLMTFDPLKVIYNKYIPELNTTFVGMANIKYSPIYIIKVTKLLAITDDSLISDLRELRRIKENVYALKEMNDQIKTLILIIKKDSNLKHKDLIINGLNRLLDIHRNMLKDYPLLNKYHIDLDIHSGNWKYSINKNKKILIPIDPFVIFYGKLKYELDFFNKISMDLRKLFSN